MKGGSGLTPQEVRIMDLWDAGYSQAEIVARTGLAAAPVQRTVDYYHGRHETRQMHARVASGSEKLLQALVREFGNRGITV